MAAPMMPNMDPRQMAMMMRKLGIEMRDIDGVEEVIVRTATQEYRFHRPSISVMKAQGTETWQVQGKPKMVDRAGAREAIDTAGTKAAVPATPSPAAPISDEDVELVMAQAECSEEEARAALKATGDLAEAILKLKDPAFRRN